MKQMAEEAFIRQAIIVGDIACNSDGDDKEANGLTGQGWC